MSKDKQWCKKAAITIPSTAGKVTLKSPKSTFQFALAILLPPWCCCDGAAVTVLLSPWCCYIISCFLSHFSSSIASDRECLPTASTSAARASKLNPCQATKLLITHGSAHAFSMTMSAPNNDLTFRTCLCELQTAGNCELLDFKALLAVPAMNVHLLRGQFLLD